MQYFAEGKIKISQFIKCFLGLFCRLLSKNFSRILFYFDCFEVQILLSVLSAVSIIDFHPSNYPAVFQVMRH